MIQFYPDKKETGQRLDKVLLNRLPKTHSRTEIQHLILEGKVTVNDRPTKSSHRLKSGEKIKIEFLPEEQKNEVRPENIPLDIIYEDEHLMVVNKPSGMVTHPGAGNQEHTLVNALLGHNRRIAGVGSAGRFGIVHRLDKDTSGLMVVAKNEIAHRSLSAQFKNRQVKKEYLALVKGIIDFDRGVIDAPIGRSPNNRKKMAVTYTNGRTAVTRYEVIKRFAATTLVRLKPETGRTHQIRVHLAHLGYPIIGDKIYGQTGQEKRLALHASKLGFFHPVSNQYIEFEAEMPEDMKLIVSYK